MTTNFESRSHVLKLVYKVCFDNCEKYNTKNLAYSINQNAKYLVMDIW